MSLQQLSPDRLPTPPEQSYAVRFIKEVLQGTWHIGVSQQVIMGTVVGIITVLVQIQNGLITADLSWAYLRAAIWILVITYGLIVLVNLIRAPFTLDKKQRQRIAELGQMVLQYESQAETQDESSTALIESEVEKTKKALTVQHQSKIQALNDQRENLQRDHEEEIRGYERGFKSLQRKYDLQKEQLDGWNRYGWLVGIAMKQADAINQYVMLERIERAEARLHDADGIPYVRFNFYIINKSVFNITVELENNARDSYIVFSHTGLREPLDLKSEKFFATPNADIHVSNLSIGCLTIEQRLSPMEAHTIARGEGQNEAIFHFDRLVFTIKGQHNTQPPVDEKRLKIDKAITLNNVLLPRP